MEFMTPYPPLTRAPLRMRGIFGIAWQLYRRGFWQTLLISLLLVSLPTLLLALPQYAALGDTGFWPDLQDNFARFGKLGSSPADAGLADIGAVLSSTLLTSVLSLAVRFLLTPMYQGALYLEMDERMEGRAGSLSQLFRYALPIGLRRFYTTFLAQLLLEIGIAAVIFAAYLFLGVFGMTASLFSSIPYVERGALPAPFLITLVVIVLLIVLLAAVLNAFTALIYPVAAREKKFAFSAVGRAFKLTAKHFWRVVGATVLFLLVTGAISVILCLPALLLWQNIEAAFTLYAVLAALAGALVAPYGTALHTALYVDIAARADGPEFSVTDPDELRDGPRTL
ncbi:MAG TPA: hypothetical protein VN366_00935 [Feifaniaceae bacterium]|nr:hypothetical protein [Feifaniaceae bacterium]